MELIHPTKDKLLEFILSAFDYSVLVAIEQAILGYVSAPYPTKYLAPEMALALRGQFDLYPDALMQIAARNIAQKNGQFVTGQYTAMGIRADKVDHHPVTLGGVLIERAKLSRSRYEDLAEKQSKSMAA